MSKDAQLSYSLDDGVNRTLRADLVIQLYNSRIAKRPKKHAPCRHDYANESLESLLQYGVDGDAVDSDAVGGGDGDADYDDELSSDDEESINESAIPWRLLGEYDVAPKRTKHSDMEHIYTFTVKGAVLCNRSAKCCVPIGSVLVKLFE